MGPQPTLRVQGKDGDCPSEICIFTLLCFEFYLKEKVESSLGNRRDVDLEESLQGGDFSSVSLV